MNKSIKRIASAFSIVIIACLVLTTGCTSSKANPVNPSENRNSTTGQSTESKPETKTTDNTGTQDMSTNQGETPVRTDPGEVPGRSNSDIKVKALYLTGWTVSSTARLNHYIDLAKNTELNSYVVDIKDDDGYVGYESQVPEVKQSGAWMKKYNPDKVLKAMHDGNVHVIGRLVCFKDPVYSIKRPDLAVKNKNGGLWKDNNKKTWLNPYNEENWSYLVNIAREAVQKGFDEIQFDYVRFPSDGNKKLLDFGGTNKAKYEAIDDFLAYAKKELPGVIISADVFGIICESPADSEGIGQNLEYVGKDVDYISPMAYPSHYAYGQIVNKVEFPKPDFEPYSVVYNTLFKARNRISKVDGYKAGVRPYLQDFTATWLDDGYFQTYGPDQVRQQIKAVYDAGYDQWILWDAQNTYDESALLKEKD